MAKLASGPEFARLHGISEQRVRQLLKSGRIPGARKIGRNWVVPDDASPTGSAPGDRKAAPAGAAALEWLRRRALPALVRAIRPRRVILFGSYAQGRPSRGSDLDLCVILDSDEDFFHRCVRVQGAIPRGPYPLDVLAYTPAEMEKNRGLPIFKAIVDHGVTLYER